jgi:hypothetical protein
LIDDPQANFITAIARKFLALNLFSLSLAKDEKPLPEDACTSDDLSLTTRLPEKIYDKVMPGSAYMGRDRVT